MEKKEMVIIVKDAIILPLLIIAMIVFYNSLPSGVQWKDIGIGVVIFFIAFSFSFHVIDMIMNIKNISRKE